MYYVYKTTNIVNNKIYVGVHKSDNIQSDQYLGSGKILNIAILKYGRDKFNRQILYEFKQQSEAYFMQSQIVDKQFVKRKDTYNCKTGGTGSWSHLKHAVPVKDGVGNTLSVHRQDPRYLSGQLVHVTKGLIVAIDENGNKISVDRNDPRLLSGEVLTLASTLITVKDSNGKCFRVSKTDPKYINGQYVGINRGSKLPLLCHAGNKNSQYGTMWITNGIQNKKIKQEDPIPQNWIRGRSFIK